MRLTNFQIESINRLARKYFGKGTIVYLFGSRTDNLKKGGDIDLFLSGTDESVFTIESKVCFLAALKAEIGDRKIDVVFDNEFTRQKKSFYRAINMQKVAL